MMSDQTDNLNSLLEQFGLSNDEVRIYLDLVKNGTRSALEISKSIKMGRTKVYRVLEKLIKQSLVTESLDEHGKKYTSKPYNQLELLLKGKELELETLKQKKELVFEKLKTIQGVDDKKSKVLFYSGVDGLKQITWNSLDAKEGIMIFEISVGMHPFTGDKFAEEMRQELFLKKIFTKQLTNIPKFEPFTKINQYIENYWELRYVDPKELTLEFELLIYNDVVAIYDYKDENDIWGIEIINQKLANMQKQLFNFIWKGAKEMKVGKGGEASIL